MDQAEATQPHRHDPQFGYRPEACPSCGYALAGLERISVCPECSTNFGLDGVVVFGVPSNDRGAPWHKRLIVWAAAFFSIISFQIVIFLWLLVSFWVALVAFACIAALVVYAVRGSNRARSGMERLVFFDGMLARIPLHTSSNAQVDSIVLVFRPEETVELVAVSPVWCRLRVGLRGSNDRIGEALLQAGCRCPEHLRGRLLEELRQRLGSRSPSLPQSPAGPAAG